MELKYKLTKVNPEYQRIADMIGGADTSNFKLKLSIVTNTNKFNYYIDISIQFQILLENNNDYIPKNTEIIFKISDYNSSLDKLKNFTDWSTDWTWITKNPPTMKKIAMPQLLIILN